MNFSNRSMIGILVSGIFCFSLFAQSWNVGSGVGVPYIYNNGGNVKVSGAKYNAVGDSATLLLGDGQAQITAKFAGGLRLSAYQSPNAIMIQEGTGNVGIGNTTPNAKLSVTGNTIVNGTATVQGNNIIAGKTGIGVSSPVEKLEVAGNAVASSFFIKKVTIPVDGYYYKVASAVGQWGRIAYRYDNNSANAPAASSGELMVINDDFELRQHHTTAQFSTTNNNLKFARSGTAGQPGTIWVKANGTSAGTFYITENQNCTIFLNGTKSYDYNLPAGTKIYNQLEGNVEYSSGATISDWKIAPTTYTLQVNDNIVLFPTSTNSNAKVTLPPAALATGRVYTLKSQGTGWIEIYTTNGELIDLGKSVTLFYDITNGLPSRKLSCQIMSEGRHWWIINAIGYTNIF